MGDSPNPFGQQPSLVLRGDAGLTILWFGSIGSIPTGYVICDGNNDTPDLRNEFVIGSGDIYPVNDSGGSVLHNHTFTTDGHPHLINAGSEMGAGPFRRDRTLTTFVNGTTDNTDILSPYHSLVYIMKVD